MSEVDSWIRRAESRLSDEILSKRLLCTLEKSPGLLPTSMTNLSQIFDCRKSSMNLLLINVESPALSTFNFFSSVPGSYRSGPKSTS